MSEAPVRIITGHYGSGKTEFSVSLAMSLAKAGRRVALADLDIVNPYFRSRERAALMEDAGIRVISSTLGHNTTLEIPALSPEVRQPLADRDVDVILDMGGDNVGAKVLIQYRDDVIKRHHELLLVVNAYRPETADAASVLGYLHHIADACGLTPSGLVSNTHLLRETSVADVRHGIALCREVSDASGVPLVYVSAIPSACADLTAQDLAGTAAQVLPVGLFLRDEWM